VLGPEHPDSRVETGSESRHPRRPTSTYLGEEDAIRHELALLGDLSRHDGRVLTKGRVYGAVRGLYRWNMGAKPQLNEHVLGFLVY